MLCIQQLKLLLAMLQQDALPQTCISLTNICGESCGAHSAAPKAFLGQIQNERSTISQISKNQG